MGKLQFSIQAVQALGRLKFRSITLAWCMLWVTSGFLFYQGQSEFEVGCLKTVVINTIVTAEVYAITFT